jgi:hypothetical protein
MKSKLSIHFISSSLLETFHLGNHESHSNVVICLSHLGLDHSSASCWRRPILEKIKEGLKELKQCREIEEHTRNKGKVTSEKEEKKHVRGNHVGKPNHIRFRVFVRDCNG